MAQNIINLPTYEQTNIIREKVEALELSVEATGGQIIDIDGKRYKAILEDSFSVTERLSSKVITSRMTKLKDHFLVLNGSGVLDFYDLDFKFLASIAYPNGSVYAPVNTPYFISTICEDATHVYIIYTNTGSDLRHLFSINKSTFYATGTSYTSFSRTQGNQFIAVDEDYGKVYLFQNTNVTYFSTINTANIKATTAFDEKKITTIYNYHLSTNPFDEYNGVYIPKNHEYLYVIATKRSPKVRHILKIRKSDHTVVALSPAIRASVGDTYSVKEFNDTTVLFVNQSDFGVVFNRETMAVTEGFVRQDSVIDLVNNQIEFYAIKNSNWGYLLYYGVITSYDETLSVLYAKTFNAGWWEAGTTTAVSLYLNKYKDGSFCINGAIDGVIKLTNVSKILGYEEVIT